MSDPTAWEGWSCCLFMPPGPASSEAEGVFPAGTCTKKAHRHNIYKWVAPCGTDTQSAHTKMDRPAYWPARYLCTCNQTFHLLTSYHICSSPNYLNSSQMLLLSTSHNKSCAIPNCFSLVSPNVSHTPVMGQGVIWAPPPAIISLSSFVGWYAEQLLSHNPIDTLNKLICNVKHNYVWQHSYKDPVKSSTQIKSYLL